jgi:hypothetical protein
MPLDLLTVIWLGLLFGWCARERLRADGPWSQPAVSIVLLFLAIVRAPSTLYFYLVHPDWAWLYLVDAERIPRVAALTMVLASGAGLLGGYYAAGRLVRSDRELIVRLTLAGGALFLAILHALSWARLTSYGTTAQYRSGVAAPIMDVKLGYVLIAVVIGSVAAVVFVALELYRDGRRAQSR